MIEIGLFATILLALDIYAIWNVLHEPWDGIKKIIWIILIMTFQLVAMVVYFVFFRSVSAPIFPPDQTRK